MSQHPVRPHWRYHGSLKKSTLRHRASILCPPLSAAPIVSVVWNCSDCVREWDGNESIFTPLSPSSFLQKECGSFSLIACASSARAPTAQSRFGICSQVRLSELTLFQSTFVDMNAFWLGRQTDTQDLFQSYVLSVFL